MVPNGDNHEGDEMQTSCNASPNMRQDNCGCRHKGTVFGSTAQPLQCLPCWELCCGLSSVAFDQGFLLSEEFRHEAWRFWCHGHWQGVAWVSKRIEHPHKYRRGPHPCTF